MKNLKQGYDIVQYAKMNPERYLMGQKTLPSSRVNNNNRT